MTTVFETQYDGSGVSAAVDGQEEYQASIKETGNVSQMTQGKLESMFKRLERPLGFLVFSDLSNQIMDAGGKGATATQVLEKGLHAVGMALTFINPPLGIFTLGMVALWDIFEKVRKSGELTSDEIIKMSDDLVKQAGEATKAADALEKKSGADDTTVKALRELAASNEKQHDQMLQHADDMVKQAVLEVKYAEHMVDTEEYMDDYQQMVDRLTAAKKHQADVTATLIALENQSEKGKPEDDTAIMAKKHDLQMQAYVDKMSLAQATKELDADQKLLAMNEAAILSTNNPAELKFFEEKEDWLKKLIQLENQHQASLEADAKDNLTTMDDLKTSVTNNLGALTQAYGKSGKGIEQATKEMAASVITDFANMEAGKLTLAAAADIFINPALAVAELAGATAINALGSTIAGAFGGNSGGSSAPVAASSSISAPGGGVGAGGSGSGPGQGGNLFVTVQGASVIDPSTASLIAKSLNNIQQSNGWTLGATFINGTQVAPGNL
jgi:hypothetical protein